MNASLDDFRVSLKLLTFDYIDHCEAHGHDDFPGVHFLAGVYGELLHLEGLAAYDSTSARDSSH